MILLSDKTGSVAAFKALIEAMDANAEVNGVVVLAGDNRTFSTESIDPILKGMSKPVIGGMFTSIVLESEILKQGVIVIGLQQTINPMVIPNLSRAGGEFDDEVEKLIDDNAGYKSMYVFVDGYAKNIGNLIESLFNCFGLDISFIGGGAGIVDPNALDLELKPCLFTNEGLLSDSAVLALSEVQTGIGVRHGWEKVDGPYKVTESVGNAIVSIDWKPALDVYKKIVQKHGGREITESNFFEIAKTYPFGLKRMGAEVVVRDPFAASGTNLILATPVPGESFVDILSGDYESLLAAAKEAKDLSLKMLDDDVPDFIFLVDCVSRYLYMGDDFYREIEAVKVADVPLVGVLSMGEIANMGSDYMEFYNKTCVVGAIKKK